MSHIEPISDPETGEHIGTVVWPYGRTGRYYLFNPGKERQEVRKVPINDREAVASAFGMDAWEAGVLHRIKRWFTGEAGNG